MGNILAFDPCVTCARENMCSMCELQMRRSGSIQSNKWISVDERLPEGPGDYLVAIKLKYEWESEWEYDTDVAAFSLREGYIDGMWDTLNDWIEGQQCHVTHWMPLPEAPKGGEE